MASDLDSVSVVDRSWSLAPVSVSIYEPLLPVRIIKIYCMVSSEFSTGNQKFAWIHFPVSHDAVLSTRHRICSVKFLVHFAPTLFFNENLTCRRRVELVFVRWESKPGSELRSRLGILASIPLNKAN